MAAFVQAREAAQEGTVLIRNLNSTLPLSPTAIRQGTLRVSLVGPLADGAEVSGAYIGSYAAAGVPAQSAWHAMNEAVYGAANSTERLRYACGAGVNDRNINTSMIAEAVRLAQSSDVVVLFLGDTPNQVGEWKDRSTLDLLPSQMALLEAVVNGTARTTASNPNATKVVLVLIHGNQLTFGTNNAVLGGVDAILSAGRPGQFGGTLLLFLYFSRNDGDSEVVVLPLMPRSAHDKGWRIEGPSARLGRCDRRPIHPGCGIRTPPP